MKIASWNVNSVRARADRLERWLATRRPDILFLQELKATEADFPFDRVRAAGYEAVVHGQKTYNGVGILARAPIADVTRGFGDGGDEAQARLIAARVSGFHVVSVYVPNGQEVGSEKWAYKLQWLERLRAWLGKNLRAGEPFVIGGDFNVAPEARDVHDPAAWEPTTLFHPDARAALAAVTAAGLVDTFRMHHAEGGFYSWWDYRMLAFPKDNGLRIDHLFANAQAAALCTAASIDREERKGTQPSDHAPVIAEFKDQATG